MNKNLEEMPESPCLECELRDEPKLIEESFNLREECEKCIRRIMYVVYTLSDGRIHNAR